MDKEQAIKLAKQYKKLVAMQLPLKALYLYDLIAKAAIRKRAILILR